MNYIDDQWQARCRELVQHPYFSRFILGVILLNALVIGAETYHDFYQSYFHYLSLLDEICLTIFLIEIGLKIVAVGGLRNLFKDRWDAFDFCIVVLAVAPYGMTEAGLARIFRLLRVIRAVTYLGQLRLLVFTLLRTLPSLGNIIILMSLLFYFYATIGATIFGKAMPEEFGNLGNAALTLFGVVTLEGWVDLMEKASQAQPFAWVYFVSFILFGTFIIINLFVAVVVSNLEQSFREQEASKHASEMDEAELLSRLQSLVLDQSKKVEELSQLLHKEVEEQRESDSQPELFGTPKKRPSRSVKRKKDSKRFKAA